MTRRRGSPAALWRSRSHWAQSAPQPPAAWSQPPARLAVPGAFSDSQLAAALVSGKEAPIMQQPLTHSQRGAPLTFNDLGASCVCRLRASSRSLSDLRYPLQASPSRVRLATAPAFPCPGCSATVRLLVPRACASHHMAALTSFLHFFPGHVKRNVSGSVSTLHCGFAFPCTLLTRMLAMHYADVNARRSLAQAGYHRRVARRLRAPDGWCSVRSGALTHAVCH
jgi:hypothetical protein